MKVDKLGFHVFLNTDQHKPRESKRRGNKAF